MSKQAPAERRTSGESRISCGNRIARCVSRLLIITMLASTFARADALLDPTRPAIVARTPGQVVRVESRVSAIFLSEERRVAVFDGHVVKAGDRLGDITIQRIDADGVRYLRAGQVEFARLPTQAAVVRRGAVGVEEDQ